MGLEDAEKLAGGAGDVAGEGLHTGLAGEHGVGAEGLAESLDGGGGKGRCDFQALGVAGDIEAQKRLLEGCGKIGVGVAEEAGEVVGGRAATHALVVDHDWLSAAEKDVAGLPIAMDQRLRGTGENCRNRFQLGGDGRDERFGCAQAGAENVVDEVCMLPSVERGVESGHEGEAGFARGGEALAMQAQGDVENLPVEAGGFGRVQTGKAGFEGVGTEVFNGEKVVARGNEQEARHGDADGIEKVRVPGIEAVVGAFGGPADQDGGGMQLFANNCRRSGARMQAEEFAVGSARGKDFDEAVDRQVMGGGRQEP